MVFNITSGENKAEEESPFEGKPYVFSKVNKKIRLIKKSL